MMNKQQEQELLELLRPQLEARRQRDERRAELTALVQSLETEQAGYQALVKPKRAVILAQQENIKAEERKLIELQRDSQHNLDQVSRCKSLLSKYQTELAELDAPEPDLIAPLVRSLPHSFKRTD